MLLLPFDHATIFCFLLLLFEVNKNMHFNSLMRDFTLKPLPPEKWDFSIYQQLLKYKRPHYCPAMDSSAFT